MIEFMVIAPPRCATTWAANWLTTDDTLCLHDPLFERHYSELDSINSRKTLGVSCTGLWIWSKWLNEHPARKVILHRDISEVNASLEAIGLEPIAMNTDDRLNMINGIHVDWTDVFDKPKSIYEFLLQKDFDAERHAELRKIEMQPNFMGLTINKNVTRRLMEEMRSI
jgi:hypothetical protein